MTEIENALIVEMARTKLDWFQICFFLGLLAAEKPRTKEILLQILRGRSEDHIAEDLGVSKGLVSKYHKRLLCLAEQAITFQISEPRMSH